VQQGFQIAYQHCTTIMGWQGFTSMTRGNTHVRVVSVEERRVQHPYKYVF
jgi:hypothetical protein